MVADVKESARRTAGVPGTATATYVLWRAAWRSALQYRVSFVSAILGGIAIQGTPLLFVSILLSHFDTIGGWPSADIRLLFAVRLAAHALFVITSSALFDIDLVVQSGDMDRFLTRPVSVFPQILTRWAPLMAVGDVLLALTCLAVFVPGSSVDWNLARIAFLIVAIVGGGFAEIGIHTFISGLTFISGTTSPLRMLAETTTTQLGPFPLAIFGSPGLIALSTGFPIAFIAYLPVSALVDRADGLVIPAWVADISPLGGVLILAGGVAFFDRMVRRYVSPGS